MRKTRNKRNLRKRYAVLGDGITEQWYLYHLKNANQYKYKISPSLFNDVGIEKAGGLIDSLLREGYDQVTYLTDFDTIISQNKQSVFDKFMRKYGSKKNILICETMPAIELWFLLHFSATSREYQDCAQVERELKRYLPDYTKNKTYLEKKAWFEELMKGKTDAVERANGLLKNIEDGYTGKHYPFSKVPLALDEFERQKKGAV